jgi:uncharacterized membrane protein YciS (DUF1049 family)
MVAYLNWYQPSSPPEIWNFILLVLAIPFVSMILGTGFVHYATKLLNFKYLQFTQSFEFSMGASLLLTTGLALTFLLTFLYTFDIIKNEHIVCRDFTSVVEERNVDFQACYTTSMDGNTKTEEIFTLR